MEQRPFSEMLCLLKNLKLMKTECQDGIKVKRSSALWLQLVYDWTHMHQKEPFYC